MSLNLIKCAVHILACSYKKLAFFVFDSEGGIDSGLPWPSPCGRLLRRRLPGLSCPVIEPQCFAQGLNLATPFVKYKKPRFRGAFCIWRRGWDSNPRWAINPRRFSRPVHSTALSPLQKHVTIIETRRIQKNFAAYHPCPQAYDSLVEIG